ncbi:MAG TPA: hypothetical protein VM165_06905 [Planctomycetaceae bacterium]|nr:hypothetical protein [Planctomycetaceae bacterium]
MQTTCNDELATALDALTYSDLRGLLNLSAGRHGPLFAWLTHMAWARLAAEGHDDFRPVVLQTWQLRDALQSLGVLSRLAGRPMYRARALFRAMTDTLLEDLHERGLACSR